jgi:hypothetical protein
MICQHIYHLAIRHTNKATENAANTLVLGHEAANLPAKKPKPAHFTLFPLFVSMKKILPRNNDF